MFLKPYKSRNTLKTLEIIIAKRMQSMGQIAFRNTTFMTEIHFDIFLENSLGALSLESPRRGAIKWHHHQVLKSHAAEPKITPDPN